MNFRVGKSSGGWRKVEMKCKPCDYAERKFTAALQIFNQALEFARKHKERLSGGGKEANF